MLDNLAVVLFNPKFPENVGSAARACANMGCSDLVIVQPRNWDIDRARPLATPKGADILARARFENTLEAALAPYHEIYGTTARTGGWRKGITNPSRAAERIRDTMRTGASVAIVFGPEDRGLTNEEIDICGQLVTIPTTEASSLNLAQAVLILLYECFTKALDRPASPAQQPSRPITHGEQETLLATMENVLEEIDFLKGDNNDYWMLPLRRFLQRITLKRAEFNLLMGICRQVEHAIEGRITKVIKK